MSDSHRSRAEPGGEPLAQEIEVTELLYHRLYVR
jgi:hypothetical protein